MLVTSGWIQSWPAHAGSVMSWVLSQSLMPAASATTIAWPGAGTGDRVVEEVLDDVAVVQVGDQGVPLQVGAAADVVLVGRVRPEVLERCPRAVSRVSIRVHVAAAVVAQPAPYATSGNVEPLMWGIPCSVIGSSRRTATCAAAARPDGRRGRGRWIRPWRPRRPQVRPGARRRDDAERTLVTMVIRKGTTEN